MSEMSQQPSGRRAGLARRIAGWAAPPLILAAAIGGFLALGSQPPGLRHRGIMGSKLAAIGE